MDTSLFQIRSTMKSLFFVFIFISVCVIASAQNNQLGIAVQYGNFELNDLKKFQDQLKNAIDVPFKEFDNYPNYYGFEVSYNHQVVDRYWIGVYYNRFSTGSRLYYEDYSGKIFMDQVLTGNFIGINNQYKINKGEYLSILAGLRLGIILSNLDLESSLELKNGAPEKEKVKFNSTNYSFSPSLSIIKSFSFLYIMLGGRYELNTKSKIYLEDDEQYLVDENQNPLSLSWNGFRLYSGIGFNF